MAGGVNKVILVGNLGQDPEVRYTASGSPVANFSVATSESWTDKNGQRQERTEWHRIVAWGKLGELCGQYLGKGRQVYLEGKLQTRQWDDRDGNKRYTTEIIANNVVFLGGRDGAGAAMGGGMEAPAGSFQNAGNPPQGGMGMGSGGSPGAYDYGPPPVTEDDVPF